MLTERKFAHRGARTFLLGLLLAAVAGCAGGPFPAGPGTDKTAATGPGVPTGPVKVALLVPQGGPDADRNALGQSLINAAKLAQGDLQGAEIELKVYPSNADPKQAADSAARALAEGAQIILGPFFGVDAQAVGPVAAAKGVKVLTFSTNAAVAGKNVFLLGLTLQTEADRLAAWLKGRNLLRVSVFHPNTVEGRVANLAMRQAAQRTGLTLVNSTEFPITPEGIREQAQALVRDNESQAILIPEGANNLRFAARVLVQKGVDPAATRLVGLGRWNDPAIRKERALVGGWFVAPDPALFNGFVTRYKAAYGANPSPIASLAYDGVAAIGALVREARAAKDADPFSVANLTDPGGFAGVNGVFRLRADGTIDRALAVMEVERNGFRVVDPAPRSFPGPGS